MSRRSVYRRPTLSGETGLDTAGLVQHEYIAGLAHLGVEAAPGFDALSGETNTIHDHMKAVNRGEKPVSDPMVGSPMNMDKQ